MSWLGRLQPVAAPLRQLGQYWDAALLGTMLLAMTALAIYLVLPQPQFTLALSPLPANAFTELGLSESLPAEEMTAAQTDEPTAKPHKPRKRKAKKPAKPPVLNINSASLQQLDLLPGVGPKLAKRIIDYRRLHGPFTAVAQLMDVKGIGEKNFAKMQPYLKL